METKALYTPELRFPDFSGEWVIANGNDLFETIVNKNHNSDLPILAITQDQGAVPREMIDYNISVTDASVASYKVVEIGDFIISLRSFQGGIEYSNYKGICSPAYIILRKKTDDVCNDFYKYYFKTKRYISELTKNLEGIRDGKMISYKQFSETKLPFPTLPEQSKIAASLSSLDNLITHTRKKVDLLKQHKKGLMQKLFTHLPQGRDAINRVSTNQNIAPELRFPDFSGDWEVKRLGEIGEAIRGVSYKPEQARHSLLDGYTELLRSNNIFNTSLYFDDAIFVENNCINERQYMQENDILICASNGSRSLVGKSAILKMKRQCTFGAFMCIFRCYNKNQATFVSFLLQTQSYRKQLDDILTGSAINNLNAKNIEDLFFVIPPTLAEQRKIADCLTSIDKEIEETENKVNLLEKHKKGLMQRMFVKM